MISIADISCLLFDGKLAYVLYTTPLFLRGQVHNYKSRLTMQVSDCPCDVRECYGAV